MKTGIKWFKRAALVLLLLLIVAVAAIKAVGPSLEDIRGFPRQAVIPGDVRTEYLDVGAHHGKLASGMLTWQTTLVSDRFDGEGGHTFVFAVPLAAGADILEMNPAELVPVRNEAGELTALDRPEDVPHQMRYELVVRQPFDERAPLTPPLVTGRAIQRVTLEGLRFTPHRDGAVERYAGYVAQKGLTDEHVEWADRYLGEAPESTGRAIFVRPDQGFFDRGGLVGEAVSEDVHRRERLIILAGGFAIAIVAIGVVFRLLSSRARYEEADAFLNDPERLS